MSQSATVSINKGTDEEVSVEATHPEPQSAEGFVEAGMVSSKGGVFNLAGQQWRIKAQRAARDEMEKAFENGTKDKEALAQIAQDAFDTYVYGGSRSGTVMRAAEYLDDPEDPDENQVKTLEAIDEDDTNNVRVIWAGVSR